MTPGQQHRANARARGLARRLRWRRRRWHRAERRLALSRGQFAPLDGAPRRAGAVRSRVRQCCARPVAPAATFAGPGPPITPPAPPARPATCSPRKPVLGVAGSGAGRATVHGAGQQLLGAFCIGDAASGASDALTDAVHEAAVREVFAPLYDQFVADKRWWLLEAVSMDCCYQYVRGVWHNKWSIHIARGRHIPDICPKCHGYVR
ncbi:hypothetical protein PsYK624_155910 [Phanerochaete sordida]|uniref:Uncharacterized protein n=1 Tax=Phanerochaete sordida TaxID=48140 RepID=A0A9P3GPV1_9APHY|nr:hypothetical protein PsYK624_155910 [Phanerochaete sordida]